MGLRQEHWLAMSLAVVLAAAPAGYAQDEAPEGDEAYAEEPVVGTDPAAGPAAEEAEAPIKPRPAEIMPLAARSLLLDVQRVNGGFVAVGERGNIVSSTDGVQWIQANVPVRATLNAVHFPTPEVGYAVGHDASIVATKDGGKTWTLQFFQPEMEQPFLDVLFLDANRGIAVGAYGLMLETQDGGRNWMEIEAPEMREPELHFNALTQLNNGDLFLIGEQGLLGLSTDQGATWSRIEAPYESSFFGGVPLGDRGAVLFALRGNVFVSNDVRRGSWRELNTGSVSTMFGGTRLPDGRVALVGVNGVTFVVDAAGKVTLLKADAGTPLSAAIPYEDGLLAVGEDGVQMVSLQP